MASLFRKIFGPKKKKQTRKDSITGRNHSFIVPYLSRLEGNQLTPGQSLIIRGFIIGHEDFIVHLTAGPKVELEDENDTLDNRLLAMRVDVKKGRIFLNACINGEWGKEGRLKHRWKVGDEFDIRIRCHDDRFEIFVEQKLVSVFTHYVPMTHISHIYINGEIRLYNVSWEGKYYTMPYAAEIPSNFFVGRKLYISGQVNKKCKQFTVDLLAEKDDVALRFNPVFKEKKTRRNSRIQDMWGREEKAQEGGFPFSKGKTFTLLIYSEASKLMVFVNDVYYVSFDHRCPSHTINRIKIDGDIELFGVHLK